MTGLPAYRSASGGRVLFLAHNQELVGQAAETFQKLWPGITMGRYMENVKEPAALLDWPVNRLGILRFLQLVLVSGTLPPYYYYWTSPSDFNTL